MALSDTTARKAKPADKPYRLADSGGLFLYVTTKGKYWRLRYRMDGRAQTKSLGSYPDVSLSGARLAALTFKKARKDGLRGVAMPTFQPPVPTPAVPTFEQVTREWHRVQSPRWAERHARKTMESLEADAFPVFGGVAVDAVKPAMVLKMVRAIEAREAPEHARKVRQRVSAVFTFAIASGLAEEDPAAVVKRAMAPQTKGRMPAIVDLAGARAALEAVEAIPARPVTRLAMRLLALTALRQGELRAATWEEFEGLDGPEPLWRVPGHRMKMKVEHVVPLSRQAVATIGVLRTVTGLGPLPFPSASNSRKPMSENALGYLLGRAGYQKRHVPHGWRASFSTIMNERFPADRAVIDLILAHKPKDGVEAAYNRAQLMQRRRELAQLWADLLMDGLPPPEELLSLSRR